MILDLTLCIRVTHYINFALICIAIISFEDDIHVVCIGNMYVIFKLLCQTDKHRKINIKAIW